MSWWIGSRDQEIGPMGWYESYRCHQPGIEDALRAGLDRFGHVSLHQGVAVEGISQDNDGVTVCLREWACGAGEICGGGGWGQFVCAIRARHFGG